MVHPAQSSEGGRKTGAVSFEGGLSFGAPLCGAMLMSVQRSVQISVTNTLPVNHSFYKIMTENAFSFNHFCAHSTFIVCKSCWTHFKGFCENTSAFCICEGKGYDYWLPKCASSLSLYSLSENSFHVCVCCQLAPISALLLSVGWNVLPYRRFHQYPACSMWTLAESPCLFTLVEFNSWIWNTNLFRLCLSGRAVCCSRGWIICFQTMQK